MAGSCAQTLAILRQIHPDWSEAELDAVRADLKASLPPFEPGTIAAQVTNGTAGRVANRLDLSGASFVVDAASASSLVALDLGARALVDRRADLALVGGVYIQPDVDFPMVFCQLGALSRKGEARPFDRDADGTLARRGGGRGRAQAAGRRRARRRPDLRGASRESALASDGRGPSLAAPSARGTPARSAGRIDQSGIDPATVGLCRGARPGGPGLGPRRAASLAGVFPVSGTGEPRRGCSERSRR